MLEHIPILLIRIEINLIQLKLYEYKIKNITGNQVRSYRCVRMAAPTLTMDSCPPTFVGLIIEGYNNTYDVYG